MVRYNQIYQLKTTIYRNFIRIRQFFFQTNSDETEQQQCRPTNNDGTDYVCDGNNVTEWNFDFLPDQLNSLTINETHLTKLPACAFSSLQINTLIIENNRFLHTIDEHAFQGLFSCLS